MLDGEILCTKILKVDLCAFAYRLFHEDFSPIYRGSVTCIMLCNCKSQQSPVDWRDIFMKQSVGKCKQVNF